MQKILLNYKNLTVVADPVTKFIFDDKKTKLLVFYVKVEKKLDVKN